MEYSKSVLLAALLLGPSLASAQPVSFLAPVTARESGSSRGSDTCNQCVAVADFNGDGKPDIVYAYDGATPDGGVLLGNGDGTFRRGAELYTGQFHDHPVVGDFNGDGKVDVLFALGTLFLGKGDGTFLPPIKVPACAAQSFPLPFLAVVADFNGDGKSDIACAGQILVSNGDGTFQMSPSGRGQAILSADFNHDGKADLLILDTFGQSLSVELGKGDGTFGPDLFVRPGLKLSTLTYADPPGIQTGDFNNDGAIDLVGVSLDGAHIVVLPGAGDGTFGTPIVTGVQASPSVPLPPVLGTPSPMMATADLNRDGNLDVSWGDAIFAGNGDGTFRFPVFVGTVPDVCGAAFDPNDPSYLPCASTHVATVFADLNGDGLPDMVADSLVQGSQSRTTASINVLINNSPGDGFTATGVSAATFTWPVAPNSIVAAFGVDLAPKIESAGANLAPTTLGGIRLHVRDRSHTGDRLAPLLYVSPGQINYVMPSSDPFAWIAIERVGSPLVQQGMAVPIGTVVPGLFSVGNGIAAATALRVGADNTETPVPVFSCSGQTCSAVLIELNPGAVYLSLYGTGFAQSQAIQKATCTVAGQDLPVLYAGPQMQFPGLDQINVLLPNSVGVGVVSLECSFVYQDASSASSTVSTNAVTLAIR